MSGIGNHRTHALPDLNPPPRARNAGLRPILRVSRNFRSGCECREFDPVPLSFSRSLYKLVHFNTRRRLDHSMAYTCVTESSS